MTTTFTPTPLPIIGPKNGFGYDGSPVYENKDEARIAAFNTAIGVLWEDIRAHNDKMAFESTNKADGTASCFNLLAFQQYRSHFKAVFALLDNGTMPSMVATSTGTGGTP